MGAKLVVLAAALSQLVVFHRLDGSEVLINPSTVTSLHTATTSKFKHLTDKAGCAIWLTDGRFITVVEDCYTVQQRFYEPR